MTTAEYNIEVKGLAELEERLARFPEITQGVIVPAMWGIVMDVANEIKEHAPVDTGTYRSSIRSRVQTVGGGMVPVGGGGMSPAGGRVEVSPMRVSGIVSSNVPYAYPVEIGRRPGTWPPIESIRVWCRRVLGDESAAFLVARKIYRRGIKPKAPFAKGLYYTRDKINARLAKALKEIVRRLAGR